MVKAAKFAVAMIARLMPPHSSVIIVASDRMPSSGSWNAIDCKVPTLRKRSGRTMAKPRTSATSRTARPPAIGSRAMTRLFSARSASETIGQYLARPQSAGIGHQRDADDDDGADEDLRPIGRHAEQDQPVLHDGEERDTEDRAGHAADAAGEAGAAEHGGGDDVELLAHEHGRGHRLRELRLDHRCQPGQQPHVAIDEEVQ